MATDNHNGFVPPSARFKVTPTTAPIPPRLAPKLFPLRPAERPHGTERRELDAIIAADKAWREAHPERHRLPARKQPRRMQPIDGKRRAAYQAYINSPEWKALRLRLMAARGYRCQDCGATTKTLHAHHRTYRNFGHERDEDVMLLCDPCHRRQHQH